MQRDRDYVSKVLYGVDIHSKGEIVNYYENWTSTHQYYFEQVGRFRE